jgi:hypothetical protein
VLNIVPSVFVTRGRTECSGLRPRNFHGVLEQLGRELVRNGAGRRVMVVPDGVRRDEPFGKADDARAVRPRLADQAAGLLGRAFAIEENGGGLNGRHLHYAVDVTHA